MKPITKVFLVIGALVFCLIIWGVFFNGGGVIKTGWNAVVAPVNNTYQSISGNDANLLPEFDDTGAGQDTKSLDVDNNMGSN